MVGMRKSRHYHADPFRHSRTSSRNIQLTIALNIGNNETIRLTPERTKPLPNNQSPTTPNRRPTPKRTNTLPNNHTPTNRPPPYIQPKMTSSPPLSAIFILT